MSRFLSGAVLGAVLASAMLPALAFAQSVEPTAVRYARGYNFNEGPQPNGCVKWCPFDQNPCDPPQFKVADGRCSQNDR
jgi:hypothetical protein